MIWIEYKIRARKEIEEELVDPYDIEKIPWAIIARAKILQNREMKHKT